MSPPPRLAIALGDPNGIGPEIALKALADPALARAAILVGDPEVIACHADRLGHDLAGVRVHPVAALGAAPEPGVVGARAGAAAVAYAEAAIGLVQAGAADAVVAGPHNETAIARAGIPFDGYPGLLARATGCDPDRVFLMLVGPDHRIVHVTLHLGLRQALDAVTEDRVLAAARATDRACKRIGLARPRLAACGLNPHAGEGGLFGAEEATIIGPALARARAEGVSIAGPFGADGLFAAGGFDAYLAMYHDQGHIPIKLAGRDRSFAVSIGTDVLFGTVGHGSGHRIAGQGRADPAAMIRLMRGLAGMFRAGAGAGKLTPGDIEEAK